jgi:hypothetical protein
MVELLSLKPFKAAAVTADLGGMLEDHLSKPGGDRCQPTSSPWPSSSPSAASYKPSTVGSGSPVPSQAASRARNSPQTVRNGSASSTALPFRLGDLATPRCASETVAVSAGWDQVRQVVGAVWGTDQVIRGRSRPYPAPVAHRVAREQDPAVAEVEGIAVVQRRRGPVLPPRTTPAPGAVHDAVADACLFPHVSLRRPFFPGRSRECHSASSAQIFSGEDFSRGRLSGICLPTCGKMGSSARSHPMRRPGSSSDPPYGSERSYERYESEWARAK